MHPAEKLAFDPLRQPLCLTAAHICEGEPGFPVFGCPDHLGFAAQLVLIVRQSEFKLHYLARKQGCDTFQSDPVWLMLLVCAMNLR